MTNKDPKMRQRWSSKQTNVEGKDQEKDLKGISPKYGPMPTFPNQRIWTRLVLVLATLVVVYFTSSNEKTIIFAKQKETVENRRQNLQCSTQLTNELKHFPGCAGVRCGRAVMDLVVSSGEAEVLLGLARRGLGLATPAGGAAILDLHSGALSSGTHFINIYRLNETSPFTSQDFTTYKAVRTKIQEAVAHSFKVPSRLIHLTHPTFFSRLTSDPPVTPHDHYWLPHVDKETYKSFHYTSLLYLNDYGVDFEGGRFVFLEPDNATIIVEPRKGRVSMFTSGKENYHHVERVKWGERFAMTVSFTCDSRFAISDPSLSKNGQI